MIISASRRTDIPTWYSPWFLNRLKAGFVYVRNPMNAHQVSRISLSPDVVDGIVFWTKNPVPMLRQKELWERLQDYMYCFQFTITGQGQDVENGLPDKDTTLVPAFQQLSDRIGPDRVIWRYDPILLNATYTVEYHIRRFRELARQLGPCTRQCVISFLDFYHHAAGNLKALQLTDFSGTDGISLPVQNQLAEGIAEIAHGCGLRVATCAEGIDLEQYGIEHGRCIDDRLFSRLLGCPLSLKKDRNQRAECGCVESLDIGSYSTCRSGCRYCYANFSDRAVRANCSRHDPDSPLLVGTVGPGDKITERKMVSCREAQLSLPL